MSVLIMGVHKSNCIGCMCTDDDSNYCWAAERYIPMEGEPEFCPMVELPDNGDLVDRDAVERLAVEIWMRNSNGDDAMQELIHKLREEVPVVIPAERSEASLCVCDNCDQRNDKGCSVCKYINERSEDGET